MAAAPLTPVSRETFLQQASFYSALVSMRPDDKLVLIRMPKEMCAADLDGQSVNVSTDEESGRFDQEEEVIGKISVKLRSKNRSSSAISKSSKNTAAASSSSAYTIRSSRRNLKVNSVAIATPSPVSGSLASTQQMRLGRQFDDFWSVNLGVEVEATPMKKIAKIVKKRAEVPLVEQPRNLRMRLLPFSTPNYQ